MEQIVLKYYNGHLNIAMKNRKIVYPLYPTPVMLLPEMYRGNLVYRVAGKSKRYSYAAIKKHLVVKTTIIKLPALPF